MLRILIQLLLLITIVLWFLVFAVNATDRTLVGFREDARLRVEDAREQLENQTTLADRRLEQIDASGEAIEDNEGNAITDPDDRRQAAFPMISRTRTRLEEAEQQLENWETWTGRVYLVKTVFPKTQETIKQLQLQMSQAVQLRVPLP